MVQEKVRSCIYNLIFDSLHYTEKRNVDRPKQLVTKATRNKPADKELDTNTTKAFVESMEEVRSSGSGKGWRAKPLNASYDISTYTCIIRNKSIRLWQLCLHHILLTCMLRTAMMVSNLVYCSDM